MNEVTAPKDLAERGQRFWNDILGVYKLEDEPDCLVTLHEACLCLDRIEAAGHEIAEHGLVIQSRTMSRPNPACQIEAQQRRLFLACLHKLGLGPEEVPNPVGRPPGR